MALPFGAGAGVAYTFANHQHAGPVARLVGLAVAGACAIGAIYFIVYGSLARARRARRYPLVYSGGSRLKAPREGHLKAARGADGHEEEGNATRGAKDAT